MTYFREQAWGNLFINSTSWSLTLDSGCPSCLAYPAAAEAQIPLMSIKHSRPELVLNKIDVQDHGSVKGLWYAIPSSMARSCRISASRFLSWALKLLQMESLASRPKLAVSADFWASTFICLSRSSKRRWALQARQERESIARFSHLQPLWASPPAPPQRPPQA